MNLKFNSTPALAMLIFALVCSSVNWAQSPIEFGKPEDVPPVKFIQDEIPEAEIPVIEGKYKEAFVPDTVDLEQRAALLMNNYFTSITVPQLLHEPFNRGRFEALPPRLTLDIGSYLCAIPKYREAFPLMRMMCGSRKGLEIDRSWGDMILRCIGPDGLFYVPKVGRPWDNINWNGSRNGYWWVMDEDVEFYAALPLGNGRLLGSLAVYYQATGDETWKEVGKGIVDRMKELALWDGKAAFFPKFVWLPGENLTEKQKARALEDMRNQTYGETDKNTSLWQTWIVTGLAQFYKATGYEPAKELAYGLTQYLIDTKYVEDWKSHFHCITLGIHAMVELGEAAGDRELLEYAAEAYDYARSGKNTIALPEIGFYVNAQGSDPMEGCSIGDMTALSVKLASIGMGDEYWEDTDRHVRNCLTAIQRTRPDQMDAFFEEFQKERSLEEIPVDYTELAEDLSERCVGTFAQSSFPNDMFANSYFDSCCVGNCARALYYVWENMLTEENGRLKVNLLMNRTSPWADIASYLPYQGKVEVNLKRSCESIEVRIPNWVDKEQVQCTLNGKDCNVKWNENYLVCGRANSGDVVSVEFPVKEEVKKIESFGHSYTCVFRGNTCVDIEPKGKYYPLFQRAHLRTSKPRYVKVERFECANPIRY